MIVLDTNVISALMRQDADQVALEWLDRQPRESLWTTAITVFEIRFGLELLAPGRRRRRLQDAFSRALDDDFEGRVLPFEQTAAHQAGVIAARGRQAGRAVEIRDAQIAGIVAARHASLATRNLRHFYGLGIALLNPWAADRDER
jgi:predicted nucleic acid-binding protein